MATSRRKQEERNLRILREQGALEANRTCFDCRQRGTTYINMTVGSFVCTSCSGLLRGLNPPHRVKSISMASFTQEEIDLIKSRGNQYCSAVWLGLHDAKLTPFPDTKDEHKIRDFMITKYEKKRFYIDPSVALKIMSPQDNTTTTSTTTNTTTTSAPSSAASTPGSDSTGRGGAGGAPNNTSVSRPSVPASQGRNSERWRERKPVLPPLKMTNRSSMSPTTATNNNNNYNWSSTPSSSTPSSWGVGGRKSLGSVSSSGSSLSGVTSPPPNNNNNNKLPGPRPSASLDLLSDLGQSPRPAPTPGDPFASPTGHQPPPSQTQAVSQPSFANFENANIFMNTPTTEDQTEAGSSPLSLSPGSSASPSLSRSHSPIPIPRPARTPSPYLAWEELEGEEVNAGTPLIPIAESFASLYSTGATNQGKASSSTPGTPIFASGVSAQFVFPTNIIGGGEGPEPDTSAPPRSPATHAPTATNHPHTRDKSPSPPAASFPLLKHAPSPPASRKAPHTPRGRSGSPFFPLNRTSSLPGSGTGLEASQHSPDTKSGAHGSPRGVALLLSSVGRRGSYQSLGGSPGSDEDEEHLLDDLESEVEGGRGMGKEEGQEELPHPISRPIPIAQSLLNRHCGRPLSSSCPTRASPLTNPPLPPLSRLATNTPWGAPGRGQGGSTSTSMTPTNATLAGATATASRPTPPGPHLPFSSNPLTPLTPHSSTSSSTPNTNTTAAAASNPPQDRYAALKDLDEEFKTQKESETSNGGVSWAVPNGGGPHHPNHPNTTAPSSVPNNGTSNSVFGPSNINGSVFGSPPGGVFGGGVNGGAPVMGTPPTAPSPWQSFSGANPFSGVNNGAAWVNGGTPMSAPGPTHTQQGFGAMVQPNPFGTLYGMWAPDPNFNQFGGGAALNGAGPGTGQGGGWANFPPNPPQPSKMPWAAANGTPNPFMAAAPQMPSSGSSYNPFL